MMGSSDGNHEGNFSWVQNQVGAAPRAADRERVAPS